MAYLFPLTFGCLTVVVMLWLLRSRYLRGKYAATWLVIATGVLLLAIFPGILFWLADLLGVVTPANIAFFVGALALLLISVQFSIELSRYEERIRRLAEETAMLRAALDGRDSAASGDPARPD